MKNNKLILFVIIIATLLLVVCAWLRIDRSESKKGIYSSAQSTDFTFATNLGDTRFIPIFNQYADNEDIAAIRMRDIDNIDNLEVGRLQLLFGKKDVPINQINLAKDHHINMIGYNLEDRLISKDALIQEEKRVYELAKENNMKYIFGPLAIHVIEHSEELALHADGIMFQLRNLQLEDDFRIQVANTVDNMKRSNPDIEVWVQLDTRPNEPRLENKRIVNRQLTSSELLTQIEEICGIVDVISIYYHSSDEELIEDIYQKRVGVECR